MGGIIVRWSSQAAQLFHRACPGKRTPHLFRLKPKLTEQCYVTKNRGFLVRDGVRCALPGSAVGTGFLGPVEAERRRNGVPRSQAIGRNVQRRPDNRTEAE